jgi:small-conductance mechanosensitive channel
MDTRSLPVKLTETELTERRDKLAQRVRDLGQAEQEAKDVAAEHKDAIKAIEQDMRLIAREIREKAETRSVEVRKSLDLDAGVEETIRVDTGEVVETRALAPHERQAKLFALDKAAAQ